ncbi:hypothetical protein [Dyella sp. GSA-30]|uniref:hypothetical protein n=1 Tax=Dyella sp. GSA-30 TaxID=2994496 RepID=UPI002490348E|nr:hypothetical protein [Dyella sp. GSA-30]
MSTIQTGAAIVEQTMVHLLPSKFDSFRASALWSLGQKLREAIDERMAAGRGEWGDVSLRLERLKPQLLRGQQPWHRQGPHRRYFAQSDIRRHLQVRPRPMGR